jgi:protein involved in polysaccharide export with SLBB domain
VIGQVERAGAKTLCREAVPLYTVLAEAVPQSSANRAVIMRSGKETIEVDLEDAAATDTLVMTGDVIRISAAAVSTALKTDQFYYINGVINGGEKSYRQGITLTQAIMASGGLSRPSAVKVTVFRQNAEGLLVSTEYSLKEIKMGKTPDPQIQAGDRIEVKN